MLLFWICSGVWEKGFFIGMEWDLRAGKALILCGIFLGDDGGMIRFHFFWLW